MNPVETLFYLVGKSEKERGKMPDLHQHWFGLETDQDH